MNANDYQHKAHEFAFYARPVLIDKDGKVIAELDWIYPALALGEEVGEVLGKFAKVVRDNSGQITPEKKKEISKEIGDVLWQVAENCTCLKLKLSEVMEQNIAKLTDRKNRNVLSGSGDNR